jgi:hypothetical protein
MKAMAATLIQVVLTLALVAILVPGVLVNVPSTRDDRVGPVVMAVLALAIFAVLRLAWPKRWR